MARLLALVAHTLVRSAWAVAAEMTKFTAVVALLTLSAVPRHMTEATARVASGARTSTVTATLSTTGAPATTLLATCLGTVARDVTNLTALVALLTTSSAVAATAAVATALLTTGLGALAGKVTGLTALVAGLLGLRLGALAAHMALLTAVVAGRVALVGAVARLVSSVATVEATTSSSTATGCLIIHCAVDV